MIEALSIEELHALYAKGELTVREAVLFYLDRIQELDKGEEGLNAVLEINPDALFLADAMDARLRAGEQPERLFGIPILLKDNINTGDKMVSSAGSIALADHFAPEDAEVAAKLREAGALILGKANMTEFANYMTREGMPSGYSSRGGQVLNPHNRAETPSGSSSGSAVGVAAGLCAAAIGTETAGSIVHPAMMNGIVGLKPTVGLVSRSGILPISWTLDTAGPMARTVRDAAALLTAMAGYGEKDAATHALAGRPRVDYAAALEGAALQGLRIGINEAHKAENLTEEAMKDEKVIRQLAAFDHLLEVLRQNGAELVRVADIEGAREIVPIMRKEFRRGVDAYLAVSHGHTAMRSLADIVQYNRRNAHIALRYGQSLLVEAAESSGTMTEPDYLAALALREEKIRALDKAFDDAKIDVMLCLMFTNLAPYTGFPCMSIPIGRREDGVPIGSYWMARRFDETTLLRAAHAAEQALKDG